MYAHYNLTFINRYVFLNSITILLLFLSLILKTLYLLYKFHPKKKRNYDPFGYLSIEAISFWIVYEKFTPKLIYDDLDN